MKVKFWGVRGSLPVPGPKTERYGGNTSCVEVRSDAGTRIIIDAGTGVRRLGKDMMREEFERGQGTAHLLISHAHWAHVQGLPFFAPLYQQGKRLAVGPDLGAFDTMPTPADYERYPLFRLSRPRDAMVVCL